MYSVLFSIPRPFFPDEKVSFYVPNVQALSFIDSKSEAKPIPFISFKRKRVKVQVPQYCYVCNYQQTSTSENRSYPFCKGCYTFCRPNYISKVPKASVTGGNQKRVSLYP